MYVCAKKGYFVPLGHVSKKEGRGAHQNPGPTYTFWTPLENGLISPCNLDDIELITNVLSCIQR